MAHAIADGEGRLRRLEPAVGARFSFDQLLKEIGLLRVLWGDQRNWENGKVELGFKAVSLVYLNVTGTPDEVENAESYFGAALEEYSRRHAHAMLTGLSLT